MENFSDFELKWFHGYLSKDVEIKYFESGKAIATFSLPLKKSKDGDTTWLNCEAWGDLAEDIADVYKKGSGIIVAGTFKTSEYNGKSYTKLSVVKVIGA